MKIYYILSGKHLSLGVKWKAIFNENNLKRGGYNFGTEKLCLMLFP